MVSRAQVELAQEMTHSAYSMSETLPTRQRVAVLSRLLYTMRPEVMAAEKKQWAEELFMVAQQLPVDDPSRDEAIATAAARLALYDCDRALSVLDTLPSQHGRRQDPRTMSARLVFASCLQRHGASAAPALLAHAKQWGEDGGFPYAASSAVLAKLSSKEDDAESLFAQALGEFERGREGPYGIAEFGGLLERAVAMETISEDAAEQAGEDIVKQSAALAGASAATATNSDLATASPEATPLTGDAQQQIATALGDVRLAAPKAYAQAAQQWPVLSHWRPAHMVTPVEDFRVDAGLQTAFNELAESMRQHSGPEALHDSIARGLEQVNQRYKTDQSTRIAPDRQSWALVSLAAYASPNSIATQLRAIEDPFWHAYFLAIAAQEVGEPTRVADPTARHVPIKEEAEPEEPEE